VSGPTYARHVQVYSARDAFVGRCLQLVRHAESALAAIVTSPYLGHVITSSVLGETRVLVATEQGLVSLGIRSDAGAAVDTPPQVRVLLSTPWQGTIEIDMRVVMVLGHVLPYLTVVHVLLLQV